MISPVKAIVAGALIFALGGLFLIAQPFDQPPQVGVPAAQSEGDGGGFTLTVLEELVQPDEFQVTTEIQDSLRIHSGLGLVTRVEASDPRLSGTWSLTWNARVQTQPRPGYHVGVGSLLVENEGGTWFGRHESFTVEGEPFFLSLERAVLEGRDGYEGLTAIVHWDEENLPMDDVDAMGVVFDFGLPPQPETVDLPIE